MTTSTPAPAESVATKQKNGVGLAALIVGSVALLLAIIPILSFIAWLPAVAAIVLGIIGLVLKNRVRLFAWIGLALGVLAWIIAIVVSIVSVAGVAGAINEQIQESSAPFVSESPIVQEETVEKEPVAPAEPAEPAVPADFASALTKAAQYSEIMQMSKQGIYDQLTSEYGEKFSPEAAQYAVDNLQADYNANALAKAKQYQETMAMSPEAIREQLTSEYGEKFTQEEADYAVANLNS